MENNSYIKADNSYIKADNSKVINEKYIRWIKKMDECLYVCNKSNGCSIADGTTHKICKLYNSDSYHKLNKLFD